MSIGNKSNSKSGKPACGFKEKVLMLIGDVIQVLESSPNGLKLIKSQTVPVDLSIPDASEFVLYEAEEEPKLDSKPSRRLRRRSEISSSTSGTQGAGNAEAPEITKPVKTAAKTGIETKYLSGTYSGQVTTTIHSFYNDLKIAYITCIKDIPVGSKLYIGLSEIFRFTVDLILREGVRLSLLRPQDLSEDTSSSTAGFSKQVSEKIAEFDEEYDTEVLDGFHQIYSDVVEQYGEAFVVTTRNGPVFTTLDGKSPLDSRDTLSGPPPGIQQNLTTTKIIPQVSPLTSYQMSYISPIVSSVPHPAIPPTALMWGFTHPNSTPLPIPKFLKYQEQNSFSPSIDANNSMLSTASVESVWYQKYVKRRMITEAAMLELLTDQQTKDEEEENDVEMKDVAEKPEDTKEKQDDDDRADDEKEKESASMLDALTSEDFLEALDWSPNVFVDEDEVEAIRNGTEVSLISSLILELEEKQQVRLAKSGDNDFQIPAEERRLAAKIQNGIARLLGQEEITPAELGIIPDARFPVLQASYMGTLPVPVVPPPSASSSSKRYQSMRNRRR